MSESHNLFALLRAEAHNQTMRLFAVRPARSREEVIAAVSADIAEAYRQACLAMKKPEFYDEQYSGIRLAPDAPGNEWVYASALERLRAKHDAG